MHIHFDLLLSDVIIEVFGPPQYAFNERRAV